jgi:hypothetical protein
MDPWFGTLPTESVLYECNWWAGLLTQQIPCGEEIMS